MQLVIAAITTEPCCVDPRRVGLDLRRRRRLGDCRAARPMPAFDAPSGELLAGTPPRMLSSRLPQRDAVLRPPRPGQLGSTVARSSSSVSVKLGLRRRVGAEQPLLLAVALDQVDLPPVAARQPQIAQRLVVDREQRRPSRRTRGTIFEIVARSARRQAAQPGPGRTRRTSRPRRACRKHLRDRQHQIGRRRAFRQLRRAAGSRRLRASAGTAAGRAAPPRPRCRRRPSRARPGR